MFNTSFICLFIKQKVYNLVLHFENFAKLIEKEDIIYDPKNSNINTYKKFENALNFQRIAKT